MHTDGSMPGDSESKPEDRSRPEDRAEIREEIEADLRPFALPRP